MQQVELPLVDYRRFYDSFKDPQPVVAKTPTSAWVYLNTKFLQPGTPRNNFVLSGDRFGNTIEFLRQTSRVSIVGVGISNWFIPNCNPRNQTLQFYSSASTLQHTVVVPEGYYTTSTALADAMVTALNTVSGASGLVFSQAPRPLYPSTHIFSAVGGDFYFVSSCDMVAKGEMLCGIPPDETPSASKQVGPMNLVYTTFVDFHSTALTQYQKLRSVTIANRSSLFVRAYFMQPSWGPVVYGPDSLENLSFAFRANTVLTSIDMQIYDSNGELLYIPDYLKDTFLVQITIQGEL